MSRFSINLFARADQGSQRRPALLQRHYNTPSNARQSAGSRSSSENRDLDVQELLGILAEFANEQAQIAGKSSHAVVEFRIGKEFADGGGIVIEFGGGIVDVSGGFAQLG